MSFQAFLDNIQSKTGVAPHEFMQMATDKGFNESTKAADIIAWLKADYDLGRGHAMALVHIIKHGAEISNNHVGSNGPHRDESNVLDVSGNSK